MCHVDLFHLQPSKPDRHYPIPGQLLHEPLPAKLLWSITVYDPETRSEIQTDQGKAAPALALRAERDDQHPVGWPLLRGPPTTKANGLRPYPGRGWFTYFRIYSPGAPAFDGSWKPCDFEEINRRQKTLH